MTITRMTIASSKQITAEFNKNIQHKSQREQLAAAPGLAIDHALFYTRAADVFKELLKSPDLVEDIPFLMSQHFRVPESSISVRKYGRQKITYNYKGCVITTENI